MPVPPSSGLALAGATVLVNLSGSPITIGRANTRSLLCRSQSLRCLAVAGRVIPQGWWSRNSPGGVLRGQVYPAGGVGVESARPGRLRGR